VVAGKGFQDKRKEFFKETYKEIKKGLQVKGSEIK
jgi:hypothetical protein